MGDLFAAILPKLVVASAAEDETLQLSAIGGPAAGVQDDGAVALAIALGGGGVTPAGPPAAVNTKGMKQGQVETSERILGIVVDVKNEIIINDLDGDMTMKSSQDGDGTAFAGTVGVGINGISNNNNMITNGIEAAFPGTVLSQLPSVDHAQGYERYRGAQVESYAHEAGYDAYMTGAVFARLLAILESSSTATAGAGGTNEGEDLPSELSFRFSLPTEAPRLDAIEQFCWRANISRSDLEYAALFGDDPVPPRYNVLYLTNLDPGSYRHGGELLRKMNLNIVTMRVTDSLGILNRTTSAPKY